jgi:hypothetical protein
VPEADIALVVLNNGKGNQIGRPIQRNRRAVPLFALVVFSVCPTPTIIYNQTDPIKDATTNAPA